MNPQWDQEAGRARTEASRAAAELTEGTVAMAKERRPVAAFSRIFTRAGFCWRKVTRRPKAAD